MKKRDERCIFCRGAHYHFLDGKDFMISDEAWKEFCINNNIKTDCIVCSDCFEEKRAKKITVSELTNVPINHIYAYINNLEGWEAFCEGTPTVEIVKLARSDMEKRRKKKH
jgi:hypothetical protein